MTTVVSYNDINITVVINVAKGNAIRNTTACGIINVGGKSSITVIELNTNVAAIVISGNNI